MNIYILLLVRFIVFAGLILNCNYYAYASASTFTELERVSYRLCGKGPEQEFPFDVNGLADKEDSHTWTIGYNITFTLPLTFGTKNLSSIAFRDVTAVIGPDYAQAVEIFINDVSTRNYLFTADSPRKNFLIPLPQTGDKPTTIRFYLPNACSPGRVDPTNKDPRLLGLALKTVDIFFEKPLQPQNPTIVNMGTTEVQPLHLVLGFSFPEGRTHRWLEGNNAEFSIQPGRYGRRITSITLDSFGMVSKTLHQKLVVSGRGIHRREYLYTPNNCKHSITIDLPDLDKPLYQIKFAMPNACLPNKVDPKSTDTRELSVGFRTAKFSYDPVKKYAPPKAPPKIPPQFVPPAKWIHDPILGSKTFYNVVNYLGIIGADKLHAVAKGKGSGVIVIDEGVDKTHPQFARNLSEFTLQKPMQPDEHGTHVCGIIQSIAPEAILDVIPANTKGLTQALIQACFQPGDVVNISGGFAEVINNALTIRPGITHALETLVRTGKAVIISLGNEWPDQEPLKNYGPLYSKFLIDLVNKPSLMGRVRIVANLEYSGINHEFFHKSSNRAVEACKYVISAPGSMILSALPDNTYGVYTGTSMSAPMVSACIALAKSAFPWLNIDQILWLVDNSARKINRNGKPLDLSYGVGILDVWTAYQLYQIQENK
jgi:hypothetical protein